MNYSFVLSKATVLDIEDILDFGAHKFGDSQATKYIIGLEEHLEKLRKTPEIGRERNDIKGGLYSLPYSSHLIFYRILKDKIRIVRVLHGSRDLIKFLE